MNIVCLVLSAISVTMVIWCLGSTKKRFIEMDNRIDMLESTISNVSKDPRIDYVVEKMNLLYDSMDKIVKDTSEQYNDIYAEFGRNNEASRGVAIKVNDFIEKTSDTLNGLSKAAEESDSLLRSLRKDRELIDNVRSEIDWIKAELDKKSNKKTAKK